MKQLLLSLLLILSLTVTSFARERKAINSEEQAAKGVIERTLGYYPSNLLLEVTGATQDGCDYFSTEVRNGKLIIKGSTPVTVCRGFYDYVYSNHYGMLTWSINNIVLPKVLSDQPLKIVVSPFKHRYYMNVCTFGYTYAYWQWDQWEKELDWMALHGFDMPLAPIGSEAIFARVWKKMGLTDEEIGEFVTGGAHFPWFRMGNMSALDGNLSKNYYDKTIALEHSIVDRMNELGMSPVFNAFAGFVPKAISRVEPEAKLVDTGWGGYYKSSFIFPETELYDKIASMYIEEWEREFGPAKYYLIDSFNEMDVPFAPRGTDERFKQIASYGKAVYNTVARYNPDAVWVLQGWMFGYQRHIWDPESIHALFSEIPDDKMMLIDLSVDFNYGIWQNEYTWNYAPKMYGKQWIYSTVPNFGGRTSPIGDLDFYLNGHLNALHSPNKGNLVGYGTAPEGVESNEVIYEAIASAAWSSSHKDIREWLKEYTLTRYGACPESMISFWDNMLKSSYGICSSRAQYRIQKQPIYLLGGRYDLSPKHFAAIESFIDAAAELGNNAVYQTDLALWAGLYAFGKADLLAENIQQLYLVGDINGASILEKRFTDLMYSADKFMESNPICRLERWINFAREWGDSESEKDNFEANARRLITIWGPGREADDLNDYGCRIWSGVIRDYYIPRWQHFFDSKKCGERFDFNAWEYRFAEEQKGVSPVTPYSDLCASAKELVDSAKDIVRFSDTEFLGCSPFEMQDGTTHLIYMITPDNFNKMKGLRLTLINGTDEELSLQKVQVNAAGYVRAVAQPDIPISKKSPVAELPIDVHADGRILQFIYLHIYVDGTKAGGASSLSIELI